MIEPKRTKKDADKPVQRGARVTRGAVADVLRRRNVEGQYAPGSQLPVCEALVSDLGASHVTVLRAIDRLREEGFLRTRRRSGIFVTTHPPHLYECAVLFGRNDGRQLGERYHRVWLDAVRNADDIPGAWRYCVHHNSDPDADSLHYRTLTRQVQNGRYAGLIFPYSPVLWENTPILDHPGIARVAADDGYGSYPGVSMIKIDKAAFLDRALELMAARRRRRVAVLLPSNAMPTNSRAGEHANIMARVARFGLRTEPYWVIQIGQRQEAALRQVTRLLLAAPAVRRPNALIVMDDHMTESVTLGVREAGMQVPESLQLVTYCNYPDLPPAHVPVIRLGFDCHSLFRMMGEAIETQRRTGKVTNRALMPVFDFERESAG